MTNKKTTTNRKPKHLRFVFLLFLLSIVFNTFSVYAHQTPTTIVLLDVNPVNVNAELQLPLTELELAFGHDITKSPETIIEKLSPQLKEYLLAHINAYVTKENLWQIQINSLKVVKGEQEFSGPPFWELVVQLKLQPPIGTSTRKFTLDYDIIIHQVTNHAAFISIRNDWETGKVGEQLKEVGVIKWDTKDNLIYPLQINLNNGSWFKGFKSMVSLGMQHIKEGTDHLLFILVLLLPAMLLVQNKKWTVYKGTKKSIVGILKIITAFTIGHSFTLIIGAIGWIKIPTQPIEILIAISILVSAANAIKPFFFGKEIFIAAGFGLVHGLAFANSLYNLNLSAAPMALSILGFNIGIELMQIFVITLIMPSLLLLSQTPIYKWVKLTGTSLAAILAIAWIVERISGQSNLLTTFIVTQIQFTLWSAVIFTLLSLSVFFFYRKKKAL